MNNERMKSIKNMATEVKRKLLTIEPKVIFLVADDFNKCDEVLSIIRDKNSKIKKVKSSYQNSETPYNHHAYTASSKSGNKASCYVVLRDVEAKYSSGSLSIAVESLLRKCIDVVIITSERPYLMGDFYQSLIKNKTPTFEFIFGATDNTFLSSLTEGNIDFLFDGEPLKEYVNYPSKPDIADFESAIPFPDVEAKLYEEKNQQLQNVIDKADVEIICLKKENQQLRSVIDKADAEISEVCIRATESERHVEHLESHIRQLLCEIDVLTSFIKDFEGEMEILQSENEVLREKGQKIFEEKKIELFSQVKRSLTSLFRDAR